MTHKEFNHLLHAIKALPPEQMQQLRRALDDEITQTPLGQPLPKPAKTPARKTKRATPEEPPLTADEFNRRLLAEGRLASLPDPALDIDDDDPDDLPIAIEGEPLSETILRERR
jgi:hypothetical protein